VAPGNLDNLSNLRGEVSTYFMNKKNENLKAKIDEVETNSRTKNIRGFYTDISDFKIDYQPRTNIAKNEIGYLFTDCHSVRVVRLDTHQNH
jgi:hypothetical protein